MDKGERATTTGLRARKKAETRRRLQEEALRLFLAKGYDATTVEEIAAAAGVSPMTFYRYFPTKEDVVLADDYDPLIAQLIAERPADGATVDKIRRALGEGLARVYAADRDALLVRTRLVLSTPALRARLWEQQAATERLIARSLARATHEPGDDLATRVVVSACLAAITTAILIWAEHGGTRDLPELVGRALTALRMELGEAGG